MHRPPPVLRLLSILVALALACGPTRGEGLLRIENCRIVDDHGPIKAMGVNYVDGFWNFARDGNREAYLPYLDALAQAKIPFIRMAFGPYLAYEAGAPPVPQLEDFVQHRARYFARLNTFLSDLRMRHIGVVLDVFWGVEAYTVYFHEQLNAVSQNLSRTGNFLDEIVSELGHSHANDQEIWLIEFINEANLLIDFPGAFHSRAEIIALEEHLGSKLQQTGDRHLIDSGNSLPRPAAENLAEHRGWTPDNRLAFFEALDAETSPSASVLSVHLYPEDRLSRPWDQNSIVVALSAAVDREKAKCRPTFIGEFGAQNLEIETKLIREISDTDVPLSAIWGFGRQPQEPLAFGVDARGQQLLRQLSQAQK